MVLLVQVVVMGRQHLLSYSNNRNLISYYRNKIFIMLYFTCDSMKKILIIIILLLLIFLGYKLYDVNKDRVVDNTDNVIEVKPDFVGELSTLLSEYDISKDYLEWVNNYYKDSLSNIYEYLKNNEYDDTIWHKYTDYSFKVLNDLYNGNKLNIVNTNDVAVMDFVGDVSLADNWHIMPEYDERNKKIFGILSEDVVKILNDSNFLVVNSEFTVSNSGTPIKNKMFTFRAKPERLSIYYDMGVDLALLANNHSYDYGTVAFNDMLEAFKEYEIPYIGAGKNLSEASLPYYVVLNGYKFAFVNCTRAEKNILTPGATATDEGVFRCYDTANMVKAIKNAKNESDYVIANVHFGKEGSHDLEKVQVSSAKEYVDAGADIVVGHHAHVLQGVEYYKGKPIIYNLGNFIFNNHTLDTAIFEVHINQDGKMDYYLIPGTQIDCYTSLANEKDKARIIKDLNSWSINATIMEDGKIVSGEV